MEAKQYDTKQPMDHWKNQRGNQKLTRDKWKQKHDNPKSMGCTKRVLREKFIVIQSYLRKQKTSQINDLTLHLKQLQKDEQNPKLVEVKKSQRSEQK